MSSDSPSAAPRPVSSAATSVPETPQRLPSSERLPPRQMSDTDLYHHYLSHTSRTLTPCPRSRAAHQLRFPTLALQHNAVFNSMLALAAVCICHDQITSNQPPATPQVVRDTLMLGYQRYNSASEQMREMLAAGDRAKQEALLVTQLLLVPFAAASQQVNHWLSSKVASWSTAEEPLRSLSSSPRDIAVIMKGIRTTIQAMTADGDDFQPTQDQETTTDPAAPASLIDRHTTHKTNPPTATSHPLHPLISTTSAPALSTLSARLHNLSTTPLRHTPDLQTCHQALEILQKIQSGCFHHPPSSSSPVPFDPSHPGSPTHHLKPWLHTYLSWHAAPTALTRPLLSFLVQVPQRYLDLILPLLDQRLQTPLATASPARETLYHLSYVQALALDIYAHWSALMLLVEQESWWIGRLPTVTLQGLMNRYGRDPVARELVERDGEGGDWWPGRMLRVALGG
ncbi:C6 transcription factor protein [Teratosphaeria destructans]|uniref:C6 transcription factor protein n=1 Tax=Teratosphaeria destructans TaxID=418781 RepID=A0A9W7W4E8_9PEZI|nr:C6 transcription factor protein [Teratosphaeria destructans]